jgi:hypothetical protein
MLAVSRPLTMDTILAASIRMATTARVPTSAQRHSPRPVVMLGRLGIHCDLCSCGNLIVVIAVVIFQIDLTVASARCFLLDPRQRGLGVGHDDPQPRGHEPTNQR